MIFLSTKYSDRKERRRKTNRNNERDSNSPSDSSSSTRSSNLKSTHHTSNSSHHHNNKKNNLSTHHTTTNNRRRKASYSSEVRRNTFLYTFLYFVFIFGIYCDKFIKIEIICAYICYQLLISIFQKLDRIFFSSKVSLEDRLAFQ